MRWIAITLILVFLLFGNYGFSDVNYALNYYGEKIFESNPTIGAIIILFLIFLIIFTDTFLKILSKRKKIKLKEKFK